MLWPNQFVNADLRVETRKNSTVLPTAAILRGPQGAFVYTVNPDKTVQDKPVTIALTQGDITVVSDGVNPGETVVTDGQDKLQRGSRIEPRGGPPSRNANAPVTGAVERPMTPPQDTRRRLEHPASQPGATGGLTPGN